MLTYSSSFFLSLNTQQKGISRSLLHARGRNSAQSARLRHRLCRHHRSPLSTSPTNMYLAHLGLVGCMLGLPAFVSSRQALSHPEAVPEGGGSGACVIDLREHPVTRALGGSESAQYATAASECKRLNALIDHSEQLWGEGNRKESVRLFYEVYAPSAPSDEIERVQAHLDQARHSKVAANNSEIHNLVLGSILDHDEPLSADGVFGGERV